MNEKVLSDGVSHQNRKVLISCSAGHVLFLCFHSNYVGDLYRCLSCTFSFLACLTVKNKVNKLNNDLISC